MTFRFITQIRTHGLLNEQFTMEIESLKILVNFYRIKITIFIITKEVSSHDSSWKMSLGQRIAEIPFFLWPDVNNVIQQ